MWIKIKIVDGVAIGTFTSSKITDEAMIQQLGSELFALLDAASETQKLLLSFKGVEFMSSAMIGKLVLLNKAAKYRGVKLKFCDIGPNVLEVFNITRLNKAFRIPDPDDDEEPEDDGDSDDPDDDDDGPGSAGVFAKLPKHPSSGGTHAKPPRDNP